MLSCMLGMILHKGSHGKGSKELPNLMVIRNKDTLGVMVSRSCIGRWLQALAMVKRKHKGMTTKIYHVSWVHGKFQGNGCKEVAKGRGCKEFLRVIVTRECKDY